MDFATESIVRDLAASDPTAERFEGSAGLLVWCTICDMGGRGSFQWVPADHADTCPWRRAREWVDANPPRHTPGYQL